MPPINPSFLGDGAFFPGQSPSSGQPASSLFQMLGQIGGGGGGRAPIGDGGSYASFGGQSDPWASERDKYGSYDYKVNAEPRISSAAEAAAQGGTTPQGLMAGFFPRYVSDNQQGYKIPSDRGGFFTAEDLFRHSDRGSVPQIGTFMMGAPSTNNWRLLGMGPGWILRNGQLINTESAGGRWGGPNSYTPSGGNSGEQWMLPNGSALGTGSGMGVPNVLQAGLGQPASWGWPGADQWFGSGGPQAMQT